MPDVEPMHLQYVSSFRPVGMHLVAHSGLENTVPGEMKVVVKLVWLFERGP